MCIFSLVNGGRKLALSKLKSKNSLKIILHTYNLIHNWMMTSCKIYLIIYIKIPLKSTLNQKKSCPYNQKFIGNCCVNFNVYQSYFVIYDISISTLLSKVSGILQLISSRSVLLITRSCTRLSF